MRHRAIALSKLYCFIHSKSNAQVISSSSAATTSSEATRYEIKGESLRGMEYITDLANGKKRRRISDDAIQAVVGEQQEQLIQAVLVSSTLDQVLDRAFKTNPCTLANAYGSKARDALVYARHIAAEDAKIASEILAKDLPGNSSLQTSSSSTRTSLEKGSSSNKSQQE